MRIQDRKAVPMLTGGVWGAKAVTLSDLDNFMDYLIDHEGNTAQELYAAVAWSYWCAQLRASSLASVPYDIYPMELPEDEEDDDNAVEWPLPLETILWDVEAWMTLIGAAYIYERRKRRQLDKLQVLNANTMKVLTYDNDGPTSFEQKIGAWRKVYRADEICYFRTFNPKDDIREGVASGEVGQVAGRLVYNANMWASKFFENGAIPAVMLTTEGPVPPGEKDRIESKWAKMLEGVTKAFKTVVLERGLKPTIIGQPIKDLAMPDLEVLKRNQILAAHNVPPGLADVKTNRAERDAVQWEFWTFTMIPYMRTRIVPVLNDQLFEPLGLRIVFHYNEIEAVQKEEIAKAESSAFMVNGVIIPAYEANVVSVDETRAVIDSILSMASLPALEASFTPEDRTPVMPVGGGGGSNEGPGNPTPPGEQVGANTRPKAAPPAWGQLPAVSLQSLDDGETRPLSGTDPSTLIVI